MTIKQKRAAALFERIKVLGLTAESHGSWIALEPPNKVPTDLLMEAATCSAELGKLIRDDRKVVPFPS